jgi:hypothetical protein
LIGAELAMLAPNVSHQLKQLLEFLHRGLYTEHEFSVHLSTLVTRENAGDLLDFCPKEAIPSLRQAMATAAQDAVDAESLAPEESVLQESPVATSYLFHVAEVLLERSAGAPLPGLTVVCLPSFKEEWAVRVRGSPVIGFKAILSEAMEKIWCHPEPGSIQARVKERALHDALAQGLCGVWKKVLLGTRHPRRARLGLDGVEYHFGYRDTVSGQLAGYTWSPEKTTVPGKLVAVSHALREYIDSDHEGEA